ncbi:hypothetical protein PYW08_009790 [Mythimna loreyi]|uniref:Uncharacterized protein n=1 Tax=Mythimna loreyi TaxID=667449 RepID=A0ACC2Q8R7_9NEOP|nr:hypothetical protein PYW08_009790 [Mythimna loreyi]
MNNKNKKPVTCTKVKNPCKYCLGEVTNKTGLQCQGACKKWAHFKCLNYTPGKISDIKAGIIKVMCPCPDCDTTQTKEFLINPPFSCTKHKCPANYKGPIKCDSDDCPHNEGREKDCSDKTCAVEKKNHPKMIPISPPSPPMRAKAEKMEARVRQAKKKLIPLQSSDSCVVPDCPNRPSNSSNEEDKCPRTQASMVNVLQEMCGTVGKLTIQIQDLMGKVNKMAS